MSEINLSLHISDKDLKQLAASIEFHYQNWPGYPAAEKEEQERLYYLRSMLRTAMMELAYQRDD